MQTTLQQPFTTGPFPAGPFRDVGRALMRRLLSGRTVPKEQRAPDWDVTRGPSATGGLSAHPDHPSRKHDIDGLARTVERARIMHAPHGGLSRRERRLRDRS